MKAANFLKVLLVSALAWWVLAPAAQAEWKVSSDDGISFIKLGFLAQGQAEVADTTNPNYVSNNLYLRRFRIMMGGQVNEKISFFFETDSPNLGKYDPATGKKTTGDIYLQDLIITYKFGDEFMVDGGLLLVPVSHNSGQGATTLLSIDYGAYSFLASAPTESVAGRDYGVSARGYLLDQHLEYRAGVFQGIRDLPDNPDGNRDADAPFRYAGRIAVHFLDPETGYFYSGTYLGKKKIFSLGASIDLQDTYKSYAGDLFLELPFGDGDAVTLQANYMYYDGDDTFINLPAQNDWLVEFGLYHGQTRLDFFSQVAMQDFVQSPRPDQDRYQAGLIYWGQGHNFNLKAGYGVIYDEHTELAGHLYRDMYALQCQVLMY